MAKRDEILFQVFEELANETGGVVTRGGIFTSFHPRLKAKIHDRETVLFFQKERNEYYLCIRISYTFPILVVIKPRYRTCGIFRLDLSFNAERIEPSIPHPFLDHFIVKTDNAEKCMRFIGSDSFLTHFQELLSPGVLEEKFFQEFRLREEGKESSAEDSGDSQKNDMATMEKELDKLPVPARRYFFYPYIILDRKGAFLKVRFDHYHEKDIHKKLSPSGESIDSYRKELKTILTSYLDALSSLLLY